MSTRRVDLYQGIHKAIRAMLLRLVETAGRTRYTDPVAVEELRVLAEDVFDLLARHGEHESRFIHPLLHAAGAPVVGRLEEAHRGHEAELDHLWTLLHGAEGAPERGQAFLLELTRFVADQLVHMADEEQIAQPAVWAAWDDRRLEAAHQALLAAIPPVEMARYLRWMLPALDGDERAGMLLGMRAHAPEAAFAATLALCRQVVSPGQWAELPAELRSTAA